MSADVTLTFDSITSLHDSDVFLKELFAQHFELRSVICVVDLQRVQSILNEPKDGLGFFKVSSTF